MSEARVDLNAFRTEVRNWLADNLPPELRQAHNRATSVFVEKEFNLAWQAILLRKGWVAPHWPVEHGGTGWNEAQRYIFASECARAGAPSLAPMGLKMVAPVIMKYGSADQKSYYLPKLLAGEHYWCQGYSEPQAGSDLAALQLRADSDGDDYVLNGSKIWTTHAHVANHMFCLVRTNRDGRPQEGITFLLLEMATPGLTVQPIISIAGDHDFNQVFFDNVRVPKANRLGDEGKGWTVAKTLLEYERAAAYAAGLIEALAEVRAAAKEAELLGDAAIRRRFAELDSQVRTIHAVEDMVLAAIGEGRDPGPASSMLKVQGTECQQKIQELAVDVAGIYAAPYQFEARQAGSNEGYVGPESALTATARYFNGRAASIYGGSNEIQRNIMAKLVLGL
ncbi:MAG: acyl-CoA dehydrogenase family protein [Sphingomonadales bacterium]|jgi:alkylation response protein AidB-like acyl-CoA dehydrogenase|nr:acyl-CoA dehydrogenase family protein [Sphingomonadales bacterium]MBK9269207.1 acyl-CoA dehydrogenase family protein [Sphingomonadales bacterium]MBP6434984.1 acyl-CoA dehydrogenase family protein [Sphingorhabdus sp.]